MTQNSDICAGIGWMGGFLSGRTFISQANCVSPTTVRSSLIWFRSWMGWIGMARKPLQARSILSTTGMLDAAEWIFAKGGDNVLTVEGVVKRDETSVGIFTAA